MKMFLESDITELNQRLGKTLEKCAGSTILLTGAAGFLGRYFMELFLQFNRNNPRNKIRIIAAKTNKKK